MDGKALLHLQPAREDLDQSCRLAEADDAPLRDVGDVHLAEEWQDVVLAQAEHLDIFDNDHLVVIDGEEGIAKDFFRILVVALGQVAQGLPITFRRFEQTLAIRVLAQADEHLARQLFDLGLHPLCDDLVRVGDSIVSFIKEAVSN